MGDPNLSADAQRPQPSLTALIGAGDLDALAGFRDAHAHKVRSYCSEVCASDRVQEACEAAFVDFAARVRTSQYRDEMLDEVLLAATRSAAAGRFEVWRSLSALEESGSGIQRDCAAVPELLAAAANGELREDRSGLDRHLQSCETCATTAERVKHAEDAYASAAAVPSWSSGARP